MAHVTPETAVALKAAGFPQPDFKTGQFWYNEYRALTLIGKLEVDEQTEDRYFFCTGLSTGRVMRMIPLKENAFFAPVATDILAEIGDRRWALIKNDGWEILDLEEAVYPKAGVANPAEAAAQLYLQLSAET